MTSSAKRGRPAKPEGERKSKNFTFRGTSELHEQLRKAADAYGRTVSDEIESRLSASFATECSCPIKDRLRKLLGD
jgi:predicted HicB family RNase H-like nuclease